MIIDFPPKVDAQWLEDALARADPGAGEPVVLRVRNRVDIHMLGEGRLLQWMRHFKQGGRRIVLELEQRLPSIEDDPRHVMWPMFRERLGGLILVDAASEVRDSSGRDRRAEIEEVQASELRSMGGEVGYGRERALVRLDRLGAPPSFRAFTSQDDAFSCVEDRVEQLAVKALKLEPEGDELDHLTTYIHELIENTREHAVDDLDGNPAEGMRFAQIRHLSVNRQRGTEQLATSEGRPRAYLDRLAHGDDMVATTKAWFVEVTVADSGVGIPARLRGSMDVYRGALSLETEATLEAMLPDKSSKPASRIGSGQGLDEARQMAANLHGLVVVRTGRLELTHDTTQPAPENNGWQIVERPHLPGTAISLLLPWWRGGQTRIESTAR